VQPEGCPFCAIADDRAHANVVYRDDEVIAFLPLHLAAYGHTLIAPREHYETLWDIPQDVLTRLLDATQMLTARYRSMLGATGVNILHASGKDAQQSVPHLHLHLLPRFPRDGLDTWPKLNEVHVDRMELTRKLQT